MCDTSWIEVVSLLLGGSLIGCIFFLCGVYASPELRRGLPLMVLLYNFMGLGSCLAEGAQWLLKGEVLNQIATPGGLSLTIVLCLAFAALCAFWPKGIGNWSVD